MNPLPLSKALTQYGGRVAPRARFEVRDQAEVDAQRRLEEAKIQAAAQAQAERIIRAAEKRARKGTNAFEDRVLAGRDPLGASPARQVARRMERHAAGAKLFEEKREALRLKYKGGAAAVGR